MKSFKQYITELFDKPLKWKEFIKSPKKRKAEFRIGDLGYVIQINLGDARQAKLLNEPRKAGIEFMLGDEGGVRKGESEKHAILNTGNAALVLSTVIDYVKYVIKQEDIDQIIFSAKEPSRKKLYWTILKRMSKKGILKGGFEQDGHLFSGNVKKFGT